MGRREPLVPLPPPFPQRPLERDNFPISIDRFFAALGFLVIAFTGATFVVSVLLAAIWFIRWLP